MAHEIRIPRLGWSMERGTFVRWLKQDGQSVQIGDLLYELEGEKALQEIEAVDAGVLRIPPTAPPPGTELPVGALLGYLCSSDETAPWENELGNIVQAASTRTSTDHDELHRRQSVTTSDVAGSSPSVRRHARKLAIDLHEIPGTGPFGRITREDVERSANSQSDVIPKPSERVETHHASPRARRMSANLKVDWTQIEGTGRNGRVRECDVLAESHRRADPTIQPPPPLSQQRLPLTTRRRIIAERMLKSHQQTAPVTLTTRADVTDLVKLRERFKTSESIVPSYTDTIAKLAATVLIRHRPIAGRCEGDHVVLPSDDDIHIGIAVDTDDGLLVPVIRHVNRLNIAQLAEHSRQLIDRARAGKLTAEEMQGGVFTISNLGAYGIDAFTPIINYPETSILGLGTIRRELIVVGDNTIAMRSLMTLSLTFDHRVIDGAPAARFLAELRHALQSDGLAVLFG